MSKVCAIAGVKKDDFLGRYSKLLKRGLANGIYDDGKVCIEAAVDLCMHKKDVDIDDAEALASGSDEGTYGDGPTCVKNFVRSMKISLNDTYWSTDESRAAGLWSVGIAQLGSNQLKLTKPQFEKVLLKHLRLVLVPVIVEQLRKAHVDIPKMPTTIEELAQLCDGSYDFDAYLSGVDQIDQSSTLLRANDEIGGLFCVVNEVGANGDDDVLKMLYADAITATLVELKSPGAKWLKAIPVPGWVKKARKAVGLK